MATLRSELYRLALSKGNSKVVCAVRMGVYRHCAEVSAQMARRKGKPKVEVVMGKHN